MELAEELNIKKPEEFDENMDPEELREAKASDMKVVEELGQELEEQMEVEPEGGKPFGGLEPATSSAKPRAARQRSPQELLALLQPPGCSFGISFQDHRFTSLWSLDFPDLEKPFDQKRLSRTFGMKRGWVAALTEVHHHNWTKWQKKEVKSYEGLAAGETEQVPGRIPKEILDELKPIIDKIERVPATRYG